MDPRRGARGAWEKGLLRKRLLSLWRNQGREAKECLKASLKAKANLKFIADVRDLPDPQVSVHSSTFHRYALNRKNNCNISISFSCLNGFRAKDKRTRKVKTLFAGRVRL